MSRDAVMADDLRERIISDPDVILEDHDLMRALVAGDKSSPGGNIVDLRGIAMERLEARLDRLEDTHRSVIAAAYENLAGTNQVHRAILRLLEPGDLPTFLADLAGDVADILRLDAIRLILETNEGAADDAPLRQLDGVLFAAEPGFVEAYVTRARNVPARTVTLRAAPPEAAEIYPALDLPIASEACLQLDLGHGRLPGLLLMGASDPHQFKPSQGTELLTFFAGVTERAIRRLLG